jgi:hypothetical protein
MKRSFVSKLLMICVLTLSYFVVSASAQTGTSGSDTGTGTAGSTASQTSRNDNDHRDYGWIGLLGLAGIAGLLRKRDAPDRDRVDHTSRAATR